MTDYLAGLNAEQREAVTFPLDKPLKVLAGAGTGKTKVLTTRYVYILTQDPDCGPENILALTFTDKAAAEMRQRITELCREFKVATGPLGLQEAWIGTFHSCCHRFLRGQALAAGLDPEFTVYDEARSRLLYRQVVTAFLSGKGKVPAGFAVTDLNFYEEEVYYLIGRLKDSLIYPPEFQAAATKAGQGYYDRWRELLAALGDLPLHQATRKALVRRGEEALEQAAWEEALLQVVAALFSAYQEALAAANALDFADLIYYTYRLLEDNEYLREECRRQFRYILVDEFQDTNRAQFLLLKLLARDDQMSNVTVVGDEKQAIYGWRNARVENIREFAARDWGGKQVELTTNYRSYQEILDLAQFAIEQDPYFAGQEKGVALQAHRGSAPAPCAGLFLASDRQQEGEAVAAAIGELLEQGVPAGDIVILLRSPRRAKPYEDALRRRGIPYQTIGGVGFYDREEIKDLLAYLRVVTNPYDNLALVRALQAPPCFCSDADLAQICQLQEEEGWGGEKRVYLYDALGQAAQDSQMPVAVREKVQTFLAVWEGLAEMRDRLPLPGFLDRILAATGYLDYVYDNPPVEVRRRVANIRKLLDLAARLAGETAKVGLDEFIGYTDFFLAQDLREGEGGTVGEDAVAIMSVHQAKGLEFPHVFLPNLTDTSFPVGARYPNLDYGEDLGLVSKGDQQGRTTAKFAPYNYNKDNYRELYNRFGIESFKDRQRAEQLQEERRLFYVALTRARESLFLSCPKPFPVRPRGPHFFRELWEDFPAAPWLRRIDNGEEGEQPALEAAFQADWGLEELEQYSRVLFNWYRKRKELPPAREGVQPVRLSATRVEAYRRCGRNYYLQYQLRLPAEEGEPDFTDLGCDPALLGTLVHQVLEVYHRAGWRPERAGKILEEQARSLGLNRGGQGECLALAESILQKYLQGPLAGLQPDPANLERNFCIFLEGEGLAVELAGKMDRIDRDPEGRWLVVDYKTNRSISPAQWEEYCRQLHLYALAFKELYPERGLPRLYIYHLTAGELLPVECQPHHLETARRTVLETAAAIGKGIFPARPGPHCRWCGYQKYCGRGEMAGPGTG